MSIEKSTRINRNFNPPIIKLGEKPGYILVDNIARKISKSGKELGKKQCEKFVRFFNKLLSKHDENSRKIISALRAGGEISIGIHQKKSNKYIHVNNTKCEIAEFKEYSFIKRLESIHSIKDSSLPKLESKTDRTSKKTQFAPQPIFATDGSVRLLRPSIPIRNLVIKGGGAKGLGYPPFLAELDKNIPFIQSLWEISGSSSGATLAFLLAAGLSPQKVDAILKEGPSIFEQMRGDDLPGITYGTGLLSANNLTRTMLEQTAKSAVNYLEEHKSDFDKLSDIPRLIEFKERAERKFLPDGLTFSDLAILHRLNPEKFKLLHMTGYNTETNETEYYSHETHPDMPCHLAMRISMGFPYILSPVIHEGVKKTDGGQGDNIPVRPFATREDYNKNETMLLILHEGGVAHQILHSPPDTPETERSSFSNWFQSIFKKISTAIQGLFSKKDQVDMDFKSKNVTHENEGYYPPVSGFVQWLMGEKYGKDKRVEADNIRSLSSHVFVVPHGILDTNSYFASMEEIEAAKKEAVKAAKSYSKIHRNSGFLTSYGNVDEAIRSLSIKEVEAIRDLKVDDSWPEAEKEFYRRVKAT